MFLDELLTKLDRVRGNDSQYMACCPAHDDRSPSLAIKEVDGKLLINCMAGCSINEITSALGLKVSDLFIDNNLSPLQRRQYAKKKNKRQLREALQIEAHILLQYLNNRAGDIVKAGDSNYLKLNPEFKAMPDEPFERELLSAIRTKNLIGQLYDN